MNEHDSDFLAQYLADRDEPCPSCRYSLRGLQGAVCPECGQALTIRVGLVEPRLAAWIFGLVGISGGFMFSFLMSIFFGLMLMEYGGDYFGGNAELVALFGGLLISSTELAFWLPCRRRIGRWRAPVRWAIALLSAGMALLGPVMFLILVR